MIRNFFCRPLIGLTILGLFGCSAIAGDSAVEPLVVEKESHELIKQDCVVLLHGLGRSANSMKKIEKSLQTAGYTTWNEGYPSRSKSVEELADATVGSALSYCQERHARQIHFVTHSLGGILVRYYFQQHETNGIGRIVMLSPPNGGSEVVDALHDNFLFSWIIGPAGKQLSADDESLPNQLHQVDLDIGIITGNKSSDPWFSPLIPGQDDGKVSVENAKLSGMKDFLVVPYGHTTIMKKSSVINQIQYFLRNGSFYRQGQTDPVGL